MAISTDASSQGGLKGIVRDQDGEPLEHAVVQVLAAAWPVVTMVAQVVGIEKHMSSTSRGEYWRLLMPGTYLVRWGYIATESAADPNAVPTIYPTAPTATPNISLRKKLVCICQFSKKRKTSLKII